MEIILLTSMYEKMLQIFILKITVMYILAIDVMSIS